MIVVLIYQDKCVNADSPNILSSINLFLFLFLFYFHCCCFLSVFVVLLTSLIIFNCNSVVVYYIISCVLSGPP